MADRRLDQSTSLTTLAAGDLLLVGDISNTHPSTGAPIIKKATVQNAAQSMMSIIVSAATSVSSLTGSTTFLINDGNSKINYSSLVTNLTNDLPFQNEASTSIATLSASDTFLVVGRTGLITYSNILTNLANDLPFQNEATTSITTITSADTFLVANKTSLITYGNLVTALTNDLPFSTSSGTVVTAVVTTITSADTFYIVNQTAQLSYANLLTALTVDLPFSTSAGTAGVNLFPTAYVNSSFTANDTSLHTYTSLESCLNDITGGYIIHLAPETHVLSTIPNISTLYFIGLVGGTTIQVNCGTDVTFTSCFFSAVNFASSDNLTFETCGFGGMGSMMFSDNSASITADLTLTINGNANTELLINQSGASKGFRTINCLGNYDLLTVSYDTNNTPYDTRVNLTDIYANRVSVSGITFVKIGNENYSTCIQELEGTSTFFEFNNNTTILDSTLFANSLCYYGSNINYKGVFNVQGTLDLPYTSISTMSTNRLFKQGLINMVTRSNYSGTDILFENNNIDVELAFVNNTINTYSSISTIFAVLNDNISSTQTINNAISPNHNIRVTFKNIEYFVSTNYTNISTAQLSLIKMGVVDVLLTSSSKTYKLSNSVFNFTYGAYAAATNTAIGMFTNGIKITDGHIQNMRIINSEINLERVGIYGADDASGVVGSSTEGYFENTTINLGNMYVSGTTAAGTAIRTILNYNDYDMKNCTFNMGATYITTTSSLTELIYRFYYVTATSSARVDGCTFNLYGLSTSSITARLSWGIYGVKNSTINLIKDNHTLGSIVIGGNNNRVYCNNNEYKYLVVYDGSENNIQDINVSVMSVLNASVSDTIFVNGYFGTGAFTDNASNTKYINAIDNFVPGSTSSFLRRDGTFDIPVASIDFSIITAITTITGSDTFVVASKTSVITYSNLLARLQADISASGTSGGTFDFGTLTAITTITSTDTFVVANRTSVITYANLLSRLQADISASGSFDFGTLTAITTITGSDTFAIASRTGAITYTNLLSRLQADISASGTGGFKNEFPIDIVTGDTTATTAHYTILVQCNSADITITLPAVASSNKIIYNIKKIDETIGNVIIDPNSSELIDGDTSHTISSPYSSRTIHCNGSAWFII